MNVLPDPDPASIRQWKIPKLSLKAAIIGFKMLPKLNFVWIYGHEPCGFGSLAGMTGKYLITKNLNETSCANFDLAT